MKHTYFCLIIAIFFSSSIFGQKVLKTNSGQRILLVDDGSWRLLSPIEKIKGSSVDTSTNLNSFKPPHQGKYPLNLDQRLEIQNLLTNFLSDEAQLIVNLEMTNRKIAQLKRKKTASKSDKLESVKIKNQLTSAKLEVEKIENNYKSVSELIKLSNELLAGEIKHKENAIASLKLDSSEMESNNTGMGGSISTKTDTGSAITKNNAPPRIKQYPTQFSIDNSDDGFDSYDCEIVYDGFDNEIDQDRKEVKTERFFSYSQEKMKPYFKSEDFIICDANMAKVGKKYFLNLHIRIKSKDANKTYGSLPSNEMIKIEMINGRRAYGRNIITDNGKIESYTGNTLYKGVFELNKDDIKDLKKHYIDHIGIIWSSGYEQYDIYNVDFISNQLKCLSK